MILVYFNAPKHQRLVAEPIKMVFGEMITTHLERIPVGIAHPRPRTTCPGRWVRDTQHSPETDPEVMPFTREDHQG
jgi:hypothetical protein